MTTSETFWYEETMQGGVETIVAGVLSQPGGGDQIGALLDATAGFAAQVIGDIEARQPPPRPIACAEGCSHCCQGYEVHVSPLEVLNIADAVVRANDVDDLRRLLFIVLMTQESKEEYGSDKGSPVSFPCPLLKDDRCRVYEARPFSCRGFNSYDAKTCEDRKVRGDAHAVIEGYDHPKRISQRVHDGFRLGLAKLGLDGELLDLTPALLIALSTATAKEDWLAGSDVFARARARLVAD